MDGSIKIKTFQAAVLILDKGNPEELTSGLLSRLKEQHAAAWLKSQPLVLSFSDDALNNGVDYKALTDAAEKIGFVISGVASTRNQETDKAFRDAGAVVWTSISNAEQIVNIPTPEKEVKKEKPEPLLMQHDGNLRSGIQLYARGKNLVIFGNVGDGAEAAADGSIFVFGSVKGRVIAGASGDKNSMIYCTDFAPQLFSIAGTYKTIDELPTDVPGKPILVRLDGSKFTFSKQD